MQPATDRPIDDAPGAAMPFEAAGALAPQAAPEVSFDPADDAGAKLSDELLEEYGSQQKAWAERAMANDRFRNGDQWPQTVYAQLAAEGRPTPVINVVRPAVQQAKGMLTSNRPRFDVVARGPEDADAASVRSLYLADVWSKSDGNLQFRQVVDDYYVRNRGCWLAYWDPRADKGRGAPRIRAVDPLTVFPDPNATDPHLTDAANILIARLMSEPQVLDAWPHMAEERDRDGNNRLDYAGELSEKPDWYPDADTNGYGYGEPFVGDNGERASLMNHGAGGSGVQHFEHGRPPIGPITNDTALGGRRDKRYLVVTRLTKIRSMYRRVVDRSQGGASQEGPHPTEEVLGPEDFGAFMQESGYVITAETPAGEEQRDVFAMGERLDYAAGLYEAMAGGQPNGEPAIFHLAYGEPVMNPQTGMQEPGEPVPMPGPEYYSPTEAAFGVQPGDPIPGSTRVIAPVPRAVLADEGYLEVVEWDETEIEEITTVGGVRCYDHTWPLDCYLVVTVPNQHNGNPYPSGDLDDVRPLQQQINYTHSQLAQHLANSKGALTFIPRGLGIDADDLEAKANMPGRHFIPYDLDPEVGAQAIKELGPTPISGEWFAHADRLEAKIEKILGLYEFQQGNVQGGPETFRGTLQMDQFGQRRMRLKSSDHESALNRLGGVVLRLAAAYDTEERVLRLAQPHPTQRTAEAVINAPVYDDWGFEVGRVNDMSVGDFDVFVVAGSTLTDNPLAEEEVNLQYFDRGIIDDVEVLKQTGRFDTDGVLRRSGIMSQMQQALQAAQEELKNQTGDNQTLEREIRHMERKVEEEKYEKRLAMREADVKAAATVATKRLDDITKEAKAEATQSPESPENNQASA